MMTNRLVQTFCFLAIGIVAPALASAQQCRFTCGSNTCNPGRVVMAPCVGSSDVADAALCGGAAGSCSSSSSSSSAMTNAYGNLGASIGVALHDWLNNQMRKAAQRRAFEAAVKQRLEQQRL